MDSGNFILRVKQSFEDEGTMILQNVGNYHTVTQITLQMTWVSIFKS